MKINHNDSIQFDRYNNIGLTKREYFVARAMQGLLVNSYAREGKLVLSDTNMREIATLAVKQADAVINYLNINQR